MTLIHLPAGNLRFRINLIKGQIAKEMVRSLLEESGYRVYSFGYESQMSQLRYDVRNRKDVPRTDSNNRLRSTPDLIAYDEEKQETYFVEVKFSSAKSANEVRLFLRSLYLYKKYWNDSIIVIVIPVEDIFYAQRIDILELDGLDHLKTHDFDLEKEFRPMEELFSKVRTSDVDSFRSVLKKFEMIPILGDNKQSTNTKS